MLLQDGSRANTEEGDIVGEFTDQELIYFPRDPRADHLYGFSPVEQTIVTINTGITPSDERGGNRYVRPTATAPHSDSTKRSA